MSEEPKKPKIDLKSRIPSKTVKGMTGSVAPGAIPPPPGAVPAPPPDLLGRRSSHAPAMTGDPNDPLGAAMSHSTHAPPPQQIVVVEADQHEAHAGSKKGVFYGIVGLVLVGGLGIGYAIGAGSAGRETNQAAMADAKEIYAKVNATNDSLGKLLDTLKQAQSDLNNKGGVDPATVAAIEASKSEPMLSVADLQARNVKPFGPDTVGKLLTYAEKVNTIESMRSSLPRVLNATTAQLKSVAIPVKQYRYGVTISKASGDPAVSTASLVDFGAPFDLKDAFDSKTLKLKTKSGENDVFPNKGDFFDKGFVSPIDTKDWLKACPVYAQVKGYGDQKLNEIVVAIEGAGDDPGTLTPGKALADKLKALAK